MGVLGYFCGITKTLLDMTRTILFSAVLLWLALAWTSCQSEHSLFEEDPFQHGVASGDPLQDAVIIWTRITPQDPAATYGVRWKMGNDSAFTTVVAEGIDTTSADRDFTVKVDVQGLQPHTYYYYQFEIDGYASPIGRTKTASDSLQSLRFAVISCSNYEAGYFNAYAALATETPIDAVLHLGDYIYEYGVGTYGDSSLADRKHEPTHEIVSLGDYRTRYAQYRRDAQLQRAHAQHPFINIWDDHEIANNAHVTGAQNHDASEGEYEARKAAARQAFYEWLPIREQPTHYRQFQYGQLTNLLMLDERLAGRTEQAENGPADEPERSMLGAEQLAWLKASLSASEARWQLLGSQVIFSRWNITPLSGPDRPYNMDAWDGYPVERQSIIDFWKADTIRDVVIVSGDSHAAWAFEVTDGSGTYDPRLSAGTVAVEFGTTSISSGNLDSYYPADTVAAMEQNLRRLNRHLKHVNLSEHGYLLLDMNQTEVRATYRNVAPLNTAQYTVTDGPTFIKRRFSNQLTRKN